MPRLPPAKSTVDSSFAHLMFPGEPPDITIAAARAWLLSHADKGGAECPCCMQFVRIYRRPLEDKMVRGLVWLCRRATHDLNWVAYTKIGPEWLLKAGGTFAKLVHWKLMEGLPNEDPIKRTSGVWRPTAKGWNFVHHNLRVPSHVYIYNNGLLGFSTKLVTARETVDVHFNYEELLRGLDDG